MSFWTRIRCQKWKTRSSTRVPRRFLGKGPRKIRKKNIQKYIKILSPLYVLRFPFRRLRSLRNNVLYAGVSWKLIGAQTHTIDVSTSMVEHQKLNRNKSVKFVIVFVVVCDQLLGDIFTKDMILKRTHPARAKTTHVERRRDFLYFRGISFLIFGGFIFFFSPKKSHLVWQGT